MTQRILASWVALLCICLLSSAHGAYQLSDYSPTANGYSGKLTLQSNGPYGEDIANAVLQVTLVTKNIARVTITDSASKRWEVPNIVQIPMPPSAPSSLNYKVSVVNNPFGFAVTRTTDNEVIFNTSAAASPSFNPFIFENYYIEFSTQLPQQPQLYGLGERVTSLQLPVGNTYTIFTRDQGTPEMLNLYGAHPFYLENRNGKTHGVFLLSSNLMDLVLQPGALTYKVIGGVVDLFFMVGDSPYEVINQYTSIIGRPHFPPYWGLGFHQCRWGYKTINETAQVVANYDKYSIPLETMWNDIDYMNGYRDFTVDPVNYPLPEVQAFLAHLHSQGRHYIAMTDPGIKIENGYAPYDQGVKDNIYIKDAQNKNFEGKVWPGLVNFPDFTNPATQQYWTSQFQTFHGQVPFDGIWIDMNEAANFCDGECTSSDAAEKQPTNTRKATKKEGGGFDPDNPPYKPQNGGAPLNSHTLSLSATQYWSGVYNTHNLYGHTESIATKIAIEQLLGKRSVIITRSSFAGTGAYVGHWLGDNASTWRDLYLSIPGMLTMGMFGIPLVGADICGFSGATTEELCTRWMQLGAFYPFSRNHNAIGEPSQEPYAFGPRLAGISRNILLIRYSLLPYYYTLFYEANKVGHPVARPIFFEFPDDPAAAAIDKQFLIGSGLMVTPVLDQGATSVQMYLPAGSNFYDYYSGQLYQGGAHGQSVSLVTPIDKINLHLKAGGAPPFLSSGTFLRTNQMHSVIIPTQEPTTTLATARKNPFGLLIAMPVGTSNISSAQGELFIDDGETIGTIKSGKFSYFSFKANNGVLKTVASHIGSTAFLEPLNSIIVYGVPNQITKVQVNGNSTPFLYNAPNKMLTILKASLDLTKSNVVTWN